MNIPFRPPIRTIEELLHRLGDVSAGRVRFDPVPGTATFDDLLIEGNELCELVDGTLVEKAVGFEESFYGGYLFELINRHVRVHNLGVTTGEAGFVELPDGPVRGPDVAFTSIARLPGGRRPKKPYPQLAPDLVVEVLSLSNSAREMARKRGEYFRSGVRLVWELDPRTRLVRVYTAEDQSRDLGPTDALEGGDVLPGLTIPVADLYAELDRLA